MTFQKKDSDKKEHRWDWIEANRPIAKKFAQERCPYKRLHAKIDEWLESGRIKIEDIPKHYNQYDHSIVKIDARDTHIEFTILWAKKGSRGTQCLPLQYEVEPTEFIALMERALARCEQLIGVKDR